MPLEIKGLKSNMLKVAGRIERLNTKAMAFDELGGALEQGLDDITAQVRGHEDDLTFAATVLGNSSSESEKAAEKPKQGAAVAATTQAAETTVAPPEVGQTVPATFPDK